MRIDRGRRNRGRRGGAKSAVDPMESVANLVDIMLVFICGLMIAIIMFWNIDLDNLDQRQDDSYQDMGQVYQDPETGKIYVIKPAGSSDGASDADGAADDSTGKSGSSESAAAAGSGGN